MTLQETAFMKSLIEARYRREQFFFIINIILFLVPAIYIVYRINVLYLSVQDHIYSVLALISFISFLRLLFKYFFDDGTPTYEYKKEIKALQSNSDANADFEELNSSVPLIK